MSEEVVLKGNRFGVQVVFDETVDFALVLHNLKRKLIEAGGFFSKGTTFLVSDKVSSERREALRRLLAEFDFSLAVKTPVQPKRPQPSKGLTNERPAAETNKERGEVKIINGTLRSGQEIIWDGSVIVFGNVNPGARIIAGGDIVVKGSCRGIVHAGAAGDRNATVMADKMMPGQIRIADVIACAPDQPEAADTAERARIRDNNIVIEPAEQREVS